MADKQDPNLPQPAPSHPNVDGPEANNDNRLKELQNKRNEGTISDGETKELEDLEK